LEKSDSKEKALPFEEDKSPEMKVGDEGDASIANARGLLNGMDRDCKDFKYDSSFPSRVLIVNCINMIFVFNLLLRLKLGHCGMN